MANVAHMHNFEPMGAREAAAELGVSVRRVQQLIDAGDLPGKKLPGKTGSYVLDPADVARYREERDEQAKASA